MSSVSISIPDLSITHLKGLSSQSPEEFLLERSKLANRIAYSFREKKKVPPTTPEYYKVCYVIGRGAFAKVCLGIQLLTGIVVAMKIVDKSTLKSDNAKKRIV
jgi:MAP/microtubule affinity-regulating kinase